MKQLLEVEWLTIDLQHRGLVSLIFLLTMEKIHFHWLSRIPQSSSFGARMLVWMHFLCSSECETIGRLISNALWKAQFQPLDHSHPFTSIHIDSHPFTSIHINVESHFESILFDWCLESLDATSARSGHQKMVPAGSVGLGSLWSDRFGSLGWHWPWIILYMYVQVHIPYGNQTRQWNFHPFIDDFPMTNQPCLITRD